MEKTKFVLVGSIILVSVQIPSIIALTTLYGINGAAVGLLLGITCQTIYLILSDRFSKIKQYRDFGNKIITEKIYEKILPIVSKDLSN